MRAARRELPVVCEDRRHLAESVERNGCLQMDRVERPDLRRQDPRRSLQRRRVDCLQLDADEHPLRGVLHLSASGEASKLHQQAAGRPRVELARCRVGFDEQNRPDADVSRSSPAISTGARDRLPAADRCSPPDAGPRPSNGQPQPPTARSPGHRRWRDERRSPGPPDRPARPPHAARRPYRASRSPTHASTHCPTPP